MSLVHLHTPCYHDDPVPSFNAANMFDFLFKRPSAEETVATSQDSPSASPPDQLALRQQEKQTSLLQAASLGGDENAAVAFILSCQFADARLAAAEQIHSKDQLEQVLQAIRNTDRRVAKLMHQRLQALAHQSAQQKQLAACVLMAKRLLQEPQLTPNQVVQLDQSWQIAAGGVELPEFTEVRAALNERLQQQITLQRTVRDAIAALRVIAAQVEEAPATLAQQLAILVQQMDACQAEREINSVPKQLLVEFQTEQQQLAQRIEQDLKQAEQQQALVQEYEQLLSGWEAQAKTESIDAEQRRRWHGMPKLPESLHSAFQQRYDQLLQRALSVSHSVSNADAVSGSNSDQNATPDATGSSHPAPAKPQHDPAAEKQFAQALDALEQALTQGLLHIAFDHDKILRDLKNIKPSKQQAARITQVRAELHRLQGWAQWGGNVSREELIKTVEDLPQLALSVTELAQKTGSMRDRWKKLDIASGPAPKPLWERFDQACTLAYAPAAAHFKKLAEERQQHLIAAQALLTQIEHLNATFAPDTADWKQIAAFHQRLRQSWHQLGPLDRKDKKRMDAEFERLMNISWLPLQAQREQEMARREQLIKQVEACNPHDRTTLDHLRQWQERWQELAKALPLERKPEQALWQRFRSACDAVFAARKASAQVADAERRAHFKAKEALCISLETSGDQPPQEQAKLLRTTLLSWQGIGAVPRAAEQALEQRFENARQQLQKQIEQAKRQTRQTENANLLGKLELCQQIEAARIAGGEFDAQAWSARWQALSGAGAALEATFNKRFEAALTANDSYLAHIKKQSVPVLAELLRLEILLSLDSPPAYAHQRLKIQVEVLQSSLRSGQKPEAAQTQVARLCAWPVLLEPADAKRVEKVLMTLMAQ